MNPEDVKQPDSPPGDPTAHEEGQSVASGSSPVIQDVAADRPVQNLIGEWQRKFEQVQKQLADLTALVAQSQSAARPAAASTPGFATMTDAELAEYARAGSVEAQQMLAQRAAQQVVAQQQAQQLVMGQLQVLYHRYPVLRDPSHPLTQKAMQAKYLLVQAGYPNSAVTDLEAIKTAIADNPDLVAEIVKAPARASEAARAAAVGQGLDGAAPRRHPAGPPSPAAKVELSPKEIEIARRHGLSPEQARKAKESFAKRRDSGQVNIGMVSAFVREDG